MRKIWKRDLGFKIIGYILAIFWVIYTALAFSEGDYSSSLWFCNFTVAFLAIACFQKSLKKIYFFSAMGIFFQTPWILDWANFLISGQSFFGLNDFYAGQPLYFMILTFLRHTVTVPLSIVLLFFFKPERPDKKSVIYLVISIIIIMVLSYFVGREYNINCSHYFCAPVLNSAAGLFYTFSWTAFIILLTLFSLYFVIIPFHRVIRRIKLV
ncbi:hypothetical protein CO038_02125 [Candidatus Pacearchaeota archaeon CG_4_9_14_0_2_um_filter_39_13]|nr:hypothetical protein [Candidatus Pacearchaeota archaeon]OIO43894.1 MAG: hypothetical protein AUJ64_01180 [Candidatus Pacearchaeota archaeon CG1_02_39_14]PJC44743.1 MAG: hypothetical protein CO038_02125 [Candidatus Pacearchaeota archaeon CG_4_9_14_0_2_um_filter_39_13]